MQRAKAEGSVSPPRAGDDGKRGWERTTHDRGQVRPPDPGWQRAGDSSVKITSAGDCSTPRPPPRAAMLTLLSVMGQKNIHHVDCTDDWKNQLLLVQNHLKNSPEELTAVLQALLREDELRTRNLPPRDVFQEPSDQGHAEIAPPVDKCWQEIFHLHPRRELLIQEKTSESTGYLITQKERWRPHLKSDGVHS
nr:uncharacterized protein LOC103349679 isoform X2 [Oryctolagus cuniculus]